LTNFNIQATGVNNQRGLTVQVSDIEGLIAGLSGWTWGTCACIDWLWVRPDQRRLGWGSRLLAAAEREATARSCAQILVSSFTFQAPEFYARHGFKELSRTTGIPIEGNAEVHFQKTF
jgi:ribosomal protein S18 acetylase RimI-like enzyme